MLDLVEQCSFFAGIAVIYLTIDKLLSRHEGWLGKLLVIAADFYLFAVLKHLIQIVLRTGELREFLA